MSHGPLSGISRIVPARCRRCSSYDISGGNDDWVKIAPGATHVLADIKGAGVIKHMWCTISSGDPLIRRSLVIRMFWDGQEFPSVEAPIGEFFGQGWGKNYNFVSLPLAAAPSRGGGIGVLLPHAVWEWSAR